MFQVDSKDTAMDPEVLTLCGQDRSRTEVSWDGQFGSIGYYTGLSYERFAPTPPIIMNGRYYYNVQNPPRYGWYCLDLRTGEELYFKNTTGDVVGITYSGFDDSGAIAVGKLAFGQIYNYESPNQHGGFAYLWSIDPGARDRSMSDGSGDTMRLYDAFTGNYICSSSKHFQTGNSSIRQRRKHPIL